MDEVVEIQRRTPSGQWSPNLDQSLDGPSRFIYATGKIISGEIETVQPPSGWQWTSNWRVAHTQTEAAATSSTPSLTSSTNETMISTSDGWLVANKIVVTCQDSGVVYRYPPVANRPLRKRVWQRKRQEIGSQRSNQSHDSMGNGVYDGNSGDENMLRALTEISTSLNNLVSDLKKLNYSFSLQKVGQSRDRDQNFGNNENYIPLIASIERDIKQTEQLFQKFEKRHSTASSYISLSSNAAKQVGVDPSGESQALLFNNLLAEFKKIQSEFSLILTAQRKNLRNLNLNDTKPKINSTTKGSNPFELVEEEEKNHTFQVQFEKENFDDGQMQQLKLEKELKFVLESETEMNDKILKDREVALLGLGQELRDVKDTMQQLASLVKQQTGGIQQIETHTQKAKEQTIRAHEELRKAEKLQHKNNCCIS